MVGLARRIDRLNELNEKLKNEAGEFHPIQCDLSKEEDILSAFEWTKKNLGGVDLLVNNAGTTRAATISGILLDINLLTMITHIHFI